MRILLIVNTAASSVTPRARVVIQKALSADHDLSVAETSRRGHATRLAQGAVAAGKEVVVVLGGDGTVNEAAHGLAGTDVALAVLPGGSTNVFARTIGFTNDPIEATGQLVAALARPSSIRRIGLGTVNGRYFLFHAGVGFDAAVVAQVERRSGLKRWAGHPLFVYAAFATWLRHYDRSSPGFAIELEDGTVIEDAYMAVCLNSDPYTYLGTRPVRLAPAASLDRPLALVTLRTLRLSAILRLVGSALGAGRAVRRHRFIDERLDLGAFVVRGYRPVPYQVDGDHLGPAAHLRFEYQPDVLRLVLPGA